MIVSTELALQFVAIVDKGEVRKERVHLKATRDGNTSFFILLAAQAVSANEVSAGARPAYWFEPADIKAGDHVIVYTRAGEYSKSRRTDGYLNHFFYWGRTTTLFGAETARVVIAALDTWETHS
jgi:hypothetical protein